MTRMTTRVPTLLVLASCLAAAAAQTYSFRPTKTAVACGEIVQATPPIFPNADSGSGAMAPTAYPPAFDNGAFEKQASPPTTSAVSSEMLKANRKKAAEEIGKLPLRATQPRTSSRVAKRAASLPRPTKLYSLTSKLRTPLKSATTAGTNSFNLSSTIQPPDQALCVGAGIILEAVNSFVTVRDARSLAVLSGPYALEDIFNLQDGALSDPRCVFNVDSSTFTLVAIDIYQGSMVAVATTRTPQTGRWCARHYYVTAPAKGMGPLQLDYPTIGWDKSVLSIQLNSFARYNYYSPAEGDSGNLFLGPVILVLSRAGIESQLKCESAVRGAIFQNIQVPVQASNESLFLVKPYTLAPAGLQEGSLPDSSNGGVLYLTATDDETLETLVLAAIRNTSAIQKGYSQYSRLLITTVRVAPYSPPPQGGWPQKGSEETLDGVLIPGGISHVQNVVHAAGKLFVATIAGVNTGTAAVPKKVAAVLYFVVQPSLVAGALSAKVLAQKYVALENGIFSFLPSLAIAPNGGGVVTMALSGKSIYPSLGFIELDSATGSPKGDVVLVKAGTGPVRTGSYGSYRGSRFGDYTASVWKNAERTVYLAGETAYTPYPDEYYYYGPGFWETRIARIQNF